MDDVLTLDEARTGQANAVALALASQARGLLGGQPRQMWLMCHNDVPQ
jgi:hypothetical protein